ncbi:hypothetical protein [Kitasatospora indigofera]|uniref:hypothetical protein n=1 Tax=Kitasatospora indigofera TaxID=67307 RepID=UPI0036AE35A5
MGTAAAAPAATYENTLKKHYTAHPDFPNTARLTCLEDQDWWNNTIYGSFSGTSDQYFYCTPASGSDYNLWWRHKV